MNPKVSLISCTQDPIALLLFAKSTRLGMRAKDFDELKNLPDEEQRKELEAVATTIKSSWEFIDVVFLIEGVTRACAQQITRTRTGSYAMQSQRVTNAGDMEVTNPFVAGTTEHTAFSYSCTLAKDTYADLIYLGVKQGDARGIMPLNTTCNLLCKYNLRSFVDLVTARTSLRTQGEYREIVLQMSYLVTQTWPWSIPFFRHPNEAAVKILEDLVAELDLNVGFGVGWQIAKAIDLIKGA